MIAAAILVALCLACIVPTVQPAGAGQPIEHLAPDAALTVKANFLGWTFTGTGDPCTPGSNLTFYAEFKGNATGGVPPYAYDWTFGDGANASTLQNPVHVYRITSDGWEAKLVVRDGVGATANATTYVYAPQYSCPSENFTGSNLSTAHAGVSLDPPFVIAGAGTVGLAVFMSSLIIARKWVSPRSAR